MAHKRIAQKPAKRRSRFHREPRVKGQPPPPEKRKIKKDGTPSARGEGGGAPIVWTDERKFGAVLDLVKFLDRARKLSQFVTVKTWCNNNRVWEQRLSEWAAESPEIQEVYAVAKQMAAEILERAACSPALRPAGPIFLLKNNHGYTDQPSGGDGPERSPYDFGT